MRYLQQIVEDSATGLGSGLYLGRGVGSGLSPVWVRMVSGQVAVYEEFSGAGRWRGIGSYLVGQTYRVAITLHLGAKTYDVQVSAGNTSVASAAAVPMRRDGGEPVEGDEVGLSLAQQGGVALFDQVEIETPQAPPESLAVRLTWGHQATQRTPWNIQLTGASCTFSDTAGIALEAGETAAGTTIQSTAGAGDVDGVNFTLTYPGRTIMPRSGLQAIWTYLLANTTPDAAARLQADPGFRPDPRKLTVQLSADGTRGFSVSVDQLKTQRSLWVPEYDIYLSAGATAVSYADHLATLAPYAGQRTLEQLAAQPEATLAEYKAKWEDMGATTYNNPVSIPPGHIVVLGWDSTLAKYGIARDASARNDYSNYDRFLQSFDFGVAGENVLPLRASQRVLEGLPFLTSVFNKAGTHWEIEQFAAPLNGPPATRDGTIPLVLMQKLRITRTDAAAQNVTTGLTLERPLAAPPTLVNTTAGAVLKDVSGNLLLAIEGSGLTFSLTTTAIGGGQQRARVSVTAFVPAGGFAELVAKLPSPIVPVSQSAALGALDYSLVRESTRLFWLGWMNRAARFEVPEPAVNDLFKASLWHSLMLPRRHAPRGGLTAIDLPYSSFAYDQFGSPWPFSSGIYIDAYIYDFLGLHDVSAEELGVLYRNNQVAGGRVSGYANWGIFTPGMIYSVAHQYLLSGDAATFQTLLPATLQALDYCLARVTAAAGQAAPATGLPKEPLNDLTSEPRGWSFNQAYFYSAFDLLGRALTRLGHPRAAECTAAASTLKANIERGFAQASTQSPVVQLRDRTWQPFVPGDVLSPRRTPELWYPTEVDTGPLHLARLRAIDPRGTLTTRLLNDHEDNLFLKNWGMANEPIYNQHAIALLERDELQAVIRSFYSMMACAFSHDALVPVEHRYAWGQYFGPPSTDGAWLELYRKMLIQEREDGSLLLGAATPRTWLENGKRIDIERAATFFGPVDFHIESRVVSGEIAATVHFRDPRRPASLLVRLRHPTGARLQGATINGQPVNTFDPDQEWVRIASPIDATYEIVARYAPLSGFNLWRQQYFTPAQLADPLISGPSATPASDGVSNFLKFALGLQPPSVAVGHGELLRFAPGSPANLSLTFNRDRPELTYDVETSADLQQWAVLMRNPGICCGDVTLELPAALIAEARRFFRLVVW